MSVQYIVEWRGANPGEQYLFTKKGITRVSEMKEDPPAIRRKDPPLITGYATIRPVVVGTIDPDTGIIIYLEDQK